MPGNESIAARLDAWGDCRILGSLGGGYRNEVLLVERDGIKLVAKGSNRFPEAIDWLEPVQNRARQAGLVVPRFVPSRDGKLWVDGVTLETWIEGTAASSQDLTPLAARIKRFHALTTPWPQRPGFASTLELLDVDRGADVDLTAMPAHLVELCRSAWRALSGEAVSAVHGDLNCANLLLTPDRQLALVDWDEARADVSALDIAGIAKSTKRPRNDASCVALLAWEVAASWRLEPEYARRTARELVQLLSERND